MQSCVCRNTYELLVVVPITGLSLPLTRKRVVGALFPLLDGSLACR